MQVKFDTYAGDLNLDGKVNFTDYQILANDWKKEGEGPYIADITGEYGQPDGKVDERDLELLVRNWLKTP